MKIIKGISCFWLNLYHVFLVFEKLSKGVSKQLLNESNCEALLKQSETASKRETISPMHQNFAVHVINNDVFLHQMITWHEKKMVISYSYTQRCVLNCEYNLG